MARTQVPVSRLMYLPPGEALAAGVSDTANDHYMINDGATVLLVVNSSGSVQNASLIVKQAIDGLVPGPQVFPIPANSTVPLGPFAQATYSDILDIDITSANLSFRAFSLVKQ